jgi:hypothetical protein
MIDTITLEQVDELYQFLQGTVPDGIYIKHPPRLSKRMAFKIIYFLQEQTGVIPDHYEKCATCGDLFDSDNEGGCYRGRDYCDYHMREGWYGRE